MGDAIFTRRFSADSFTPITATGGTVTDVGDYRIHTFTSVGTSTFIITNTGTDGTVEYLIVGGGGAGGGGLGGGGGAGGMIDSTIDSNLSPIQVTTQSYSIVVGAGGLGDNKDATIRGGNTSGSNSSAFGLIALGGGAGGQHRENNSPPRTGGSGGGAGTAPQTGVSTGQAGLQPSSASGGYGNKGGNAPSNGANPYDGAGGGGAGGAGINIGSNRIATSGGPGRQSNIDGLNYWYAGGGGGGSTGRNGGTGGNGGIGGGGGGASDLTPDGVTNSNGRNTGSSPTLNVGGSGGANTGGGGGGHGWVDAGGIHGPGGAGGSGIVIIRYPLVKVN